MSKREHYLMVCVNRRPDGSPKGSCAANGSEAVHAALKEELAKRGLHKLVAKACTCSCLDACQSGPNILLEPEHVMYSHVKVEDVGEIVDGLEKGFVVQRLVG